MPTIHQTGGYRPPVRKRHRLALSLDEREEISRGLVAKRSIRDIAANLSRAPSTISREVRRHGGAKQYRAAKADTAAWENALRPKPCKLIESPTLCKIIAEKMHQDWSPEQIAGWLKRCYPDNQEMHVSHETIYKTLFIQTRGALKKELQQCLRSGRAVRRSRTSSLKGKGLGKIPNAIPISERPPEASDRAIPGHWEGDLIQGCHTRFAVATDIQIYFCDPQSPWQRGSNENTNRLLRQYFPKGTDLSVHSQQRLNSVARQLNERPRKTLDYESPAERFNKCVASIS